MVEILQFMLIAVFAGFLGSLVGLGGGIIITPALTILFGFDIKYAIGASIVAVIATSSGSAIAFVKDHVSNMRVGMLLEVFTTAGGVVGALMAGVFSSKLLYIFFSLILLNSFYGMLKKTGLILLPLPKWWVRICTRRRKGCRACRCPVSAGLR